MQKVNFLYSDGYVDILQSSNNVYFLKMKSWAIKELCFLVQKQKIKWKIQIINKIKWNNEK